MSTTLLKTRIGPADHGLRMSLDEFDHIEVEPGYQYELSRGEITVSDVPNVRHFALVQALQDLLFHYKFTHPGVIYAIASGSDCKLLIPPYDSERHPDVAAYLEPPPITDVWSLWVPALVIEVVSPSSRHRDYELKPDEYLQFGVSEYWIVDADEHRLTVLQHRGSAWAKTIVSPPAHHHTALLPGLDVSAEALFAAVSSLPPEGDAGSR